MAVSPKSNTKSVSREQPNKSKSSPPPTQEVTESHISGKPDKALYDAEQTKLKTEIDAVQAKFNAVRDKINLTAKDGPNAERRKTLRAEMDELRNQQATGKNSRGKTLDQLKTLNEDIARKSKDLQSAKSKLAFRTVVDLEAHVKKLEAQIDSGSLKVAEEKRALQEVSQTKRLRKTLEGFQKDQQVIDEDRARAGELRKQLDDPKSKAVAERFDAIKQELDHLRKEGDEAMASRNALYTERNTLKEKLDELYTKKKQSAQSFREANDRFHLKVAEDRARRMERRRQQKAAEEAEKNQETADRLREEAAFPAFQREIEECQLLIEHFSSIQKGATPDVPTSLPSNQAKLTSVPALELRQVDLKPQAGMTALRRKNEDEDSYFVGTKGKKKGGAKTPAGTTTTTGPLKLPFHIIEALMKMSIPAPSPDEIPRVLNDIKTKKTWFEANQERMTTENKAKAEREIQRLIGKPTESNTSNTDEGTELPLESSVTSLNGAASSDVPPTEPVEAKVEAEAQ